MENFDLFRIDGHTLRVFLSVCETGSVTRTAEIFGLNQSTISHTIDKMRAAVGDVLFVKTGRNIMPSEKSLAILPRVQKILADIEGLVAPEDYDVSVDTRPVRIAIPTPALLSQMKTLHARLSRLGPGVLLDLRRLAPRNRVVDILTQNDVELAIAVSGFKYPTTLNHCFYGSDDLVVFYDPACRGPVRSIEEYCNARHGMVSFGGDERSEIEKVLERRGLKREISLCAPTTSMLGDLIHGTDVIATMPRRLGDFTYRGLSHVVPPFPIPPIVYDLVWHRRFEHSGRNKWLRHLVLDAREAAQGECYPICLPKVT